MLRKNRTPWIFALLVVALGGLPLVASAGEAGGSEPKAHGKLVVVLTSGLEDLQSVNMAIRHAGMAKKSGYLEDVVLLVYGRGVQVFAKEVTAKPPQIGKTIEEAKEAGVHILICAEARRSLTFRRMSWSRVSRRWFRTRSLRSRNWCPRGIKFSSIDRSLWESRSRRFGRPWALRLIGIEEDLWTLMEKGYI